MALSAYPKPGQLLICDFSDFVPPEMTKRRPVVVVSRRSRKSLTCTVVPLSSSPPEESQPYHHLMDSASLVGKFSGVETWAKCDMVTTVSINRLDRIRTGRDHQGKRIYSTAHITGEDFLAIKEGMRYWLNL
ncbi:MAG: type II toxin-antitoxin system PemK/MazF family toxin [Gammaproteobacteria bacterium]|nr:type II toxin-antitoxin system PemK/MazF family toxin [Gammaproteobacteria bacterium]MDE0286090.1 type II toxin-antitoxin system PemK/MazF family toxin [Gammaproteobacteria bacterium]MDE0510970.1 type II toxin-antitoxin system PemK/MazF family toxin [Gammaproteobacteria bacterium]